MDRDANKAYDKKLNRKPKVKKSKKKFKTGASKPEIKIKLILKKLGIKHHREYIFKDLVNPETNCNLRFDFYLPEINMCIEYEGPQHYKYMAKYHGKDRTLGLRNLLNLQKRDQLKNEYCKKNNIKLLRISYKDENIMEDLIISSKNT